MPPRTQNITAAINIKVPIPDTVFRPRFLRLNTINPRSNPYGSIQGFRAVTKAGDNSDFPILIHKSICAVSLTFFISVFCFILSAAFLFQGIKKTGRFFYFYRSDFKIY